jgi:hypothetical protein
MIQSKGNAINYLLDYKNGKIKQGIGIGCELDNYIRFKRGQLNIILGHDNVGKTYFITWYFLALAMTNKLRFVLWMGENQKGQILRDMVQMYYGVKFSELTDTEIQRGSAYIENFFDFVDNSKLYKPQDLLDLFEQSDADACLIDPFTGLDRDMTYEGNYRFLNIARKFTNSTKKTIYINTHPNSESGRSGNLYADGDWKGHLKPPLKDHVEGGKAFLNRCDDMFVVHRLIKHESMRFYTMFSAEKIKDTDTGGSITRLNEPLLFEFNYGLGFKIWEVDVLAPYRPIRNGIETKFKF